MKILCNNSSLVFGVSTPILKTYTMQGGQYVNKKIDSSGNVVDETTYANSWAVSEYMPVDVETIDSLSCASSTCCVAFYDENKTPIEAWQSKDSRLGYTNSINQYIYCGTATNLAIPSGTRYVRFMSQRTMAGVKEFNSITAKAYKVPEGATVL